MSEDDIVHENGMYWVLKTKSAYSVMVNGLTHSMADSSYELSDDGLSISKARCDYLAETCEPSRRFEALRKAQWQA